MNHLIDYIPVALGKGSVVVRLGSIVRMYQITADGGGSSTRVVMADGNEITLTDVSIDTARQQWDNAVTQHIKFWMEGTND